MEYVSTADFAEAKEHLQRTLVITYEDLSNLETNVLRNVRMKRKKRRLTLRIVSVIAAVVLCIGGVWASGFIKVRGIDIAHPGASQNGVSKPQDTLIIDGNVQEHGAYIIHNNSYYVSTKQEVDPSMLGQLIGPVKRIGVWELKREGDSNMYVPQVTTMYTWKGVDPSKMIIVKIRRNSQGEKALNDAYTYEVFRNDGEVHTDTSKIFNGKGDAEEVGIALKNIEKADPYLFEVKGMGDRAIPIIAYFTPPEQVKSSQGTVRLDYQVKEAEAQQNGMKVPGILTIYEYGVDTKGQNPSTIFGEAFKNTTLNVIGEFDQNGIHWQEYFKNVYLGQKGNTYYEIHLQGQLTDAKFREMIAHFQPVA